LAECPAAAWIAGRLVNGGLPENSMATPTGGSWPTAAESLAIPFGR